MDEFVAERARWFLPEGMIRYEGGASPGAIRVLRVRGMSMDPELSEGDRLLVDTARRIPETGEMFVLWNGTGLRVKRVEHLRTNGGTPELAAAVSRPEPWGLHPPRERRAHRRQGALDRQKGVNGGGFRRGCLNGRHWVASVTTFDFLGFTHVRGR